ncbi:hypothetical protein TSAR_006854 [Trichomalopsis sarcophagae]|uniref:Reverse transcriptase domain-containing protein n=1 Tax=Trichomalopsis sarcophagae TaxID=543379 RepID=A0A232F822_9HYME|nr:hypothetical protein TSAR_006854 [Trichomalopsis sarcophagae]
MRLSSSLAREKLATGLTSQLPTTKPPTTTLAPRKLQLPISAPRIHRRLPQQPPTPLQPPRLQSRLPPFKFLLPLNSTANKELPTKRPPSLYSLHNQGPFIIFAVPIDPQLVKDHLHPTTIGRLIASKHQGNIISISPSGSLKISITLSNRLSANSLLLDPSFKEQNLRFSVPLNRLNRQAITRDVPTDISDDVILQEFQAASSSSTSFKVIKAERLNRRITLQENTTKLVPSKTIRLTFEGQHLPSFINLFYVRYPIHVYIQPVKMCFNCFRYGHLKTQCRSKPICERCGQPSHPSVSECPCATAQPICVNCGLNHLPKDKSCPEWKFQQQLHSFAATNNLSLNDALSHVLRTDPPEHNSRTRPKSRRTNHPGPSLAPPPLFFNPHSDFASPPTTPPTTTQWVSPSQPYIYPKPPSRPPGFSQRTPSLSSEHINCLFSPNGRPLALSQPSPSTSAPISPVDLAFSSELDPPTTAPTESPQPSSPLLPPPPSDPKASMASPITMTNKVPAPQSNFSKRRASDCDLGRVLELCSGGLGEVVGSSERIKLLLKFPLRAGLVLGEVIEAATLPVSFFSNSPCGHSSPSYASVMRSYRPPLNGSPPHNRTSTPKPPSRPPGFSQRTPSLPSEHINCLFSPNGRPLALSQPSPSTSAPISPVDLAFSSELDPPTTAPTESPQPSSPLLPPPPSDPKASVSYLLKIVFVIVRNDRPVDREGGTAICIRNSIPFNPIITYNSTHNLESNAVSIITSQGELLIVSVYRPPNSPFDNIHLQRLLSSIDSFSSILLAGDFNCHNAAWGSSSTCNLGDYLLNFLSDNNLLIANNGSPTYLNRRNPDNPSCLDLAFISPHLFSICSWSVLEDNLLSDHYPISITLGIPAPFASFRSHRPNYRRISPANRIAFENSLSELPTDFFPVNASPSERYEALTSFILRTIEDFIPHSRSSNKRPKAPEPPWWNEDCSKAEIASKAALKNFRRDPNLYIKLLSAEDHARTVFTQAKKDSYRDACSSLTPRFDPKKFWDLIQRFRHRNLGSSNARSNMANIAKQNDLIPSICPPSSLYPNFPSVFTPSLLTNNLFCKPFSRTELAIAVNQCIAKTNSAPGLDKIDNLLISHFPDIIHEHLLSIFNDFFLKDIKGAFDGVDPGILVHILRDLGLPWQICKFFYNLTCSRSVYFNVGGVIQGPFETLKGVPQGCCTSPVAYNIYTHKLPNHIDPDCQYLCFADDVALFVSSPDLNFCTTVLQNSLITIASYFDSLGLSIAPEKTQLITFSRKQTDTSETSRAPSTVSTTAFSFTSSATLAYLGKSANSFITSPALDVYFNVGGEIQGSFETLKGVPQGCCTSPVAYNIYTHKLPDHIDPDCQYLCFADDVTLFVSSPDLNFCTTVLQNSLNTIASYFDSLGLSIAPEKTQLIIFSSKQTDTSEVALTFGDTIIHSIPQPTPKLILLPGNMANIAKQNDLIPSICSPSCLYPNFPSVFTPSLLTNNLFCKPFSRTQLDIAVNQCIAKTNSALDLDKIDNLLISHFPNIIYEHLLSIFNDFFLKDIKGAFDGVDPGILFHILRDLGLPWQICKVFYNLTCSRSVYFNVGGEIQGPFETLKGVPQSCCTSPVAYNIYTHKLPDHIDPDCQYLCFADDVALFVSSPDLNFFTTVLQNSLNTITHQLIIFSRKQTDTSEVTLTFDDTIIHSIPNVTFDSKLSWTPHYQSLIQKGTRYTNLIRSLCGTWWRGNPQSLIQIYKAFVMGPIDYGSIVFLPRDRSLHYATPRAQILSRPSPLHP